MLEENWCRYYLSVCINYIRLHKFALILHHGTIADNMEETTISWNIHTTVMSATSIWQGNVTLKLDTEANDKILCITVIFYQSIACKPSHSQMQWASAQYMWVTFVFVSLIYRWNVSSWSLYCNNKSPDYTLHLIL